MKSLSFRASAVALSATFIGLTFAPVAAQADHWRYRHGYYGHHHDGGRTAAAIAGVGILGLAAGAAMAESSRERCRLERQRFRDSRGVRRTRTIEVCR
ncbi:hypothetical protein JOD31_002694 [Methylopila capsulata]|uniref:Uncharacterized protein n=1 Tax=Methylopila capsulata TaxID=61654 RepID=A0A9W6IX13_9HYPH|nr:hypothetical protein [Methylopila capsulata]MBM7852452.1 hypothetical protein [Methylopila capsulata]GLK56661.1 hypothetical protein GCM10008170_26800 [Methylopila capsulata]